MALHKGRNTRGNSVTRYYRLYPPSFEQAHIDALRKACIFEATAKNVLRCLACGGRIPAFSKYKYADNGVRYMRPLIVHTECPGDTNVKDH